MNVQNEAERASTMNLADTIDVGRVLLSIPDAAFALGVGRTQIYELIDAGCLVRVKIGSRALIPADSVREYAARLVAEAAERAAS